MKARRTEPQTRTHTPGEVWLANGRRGIMTCSGLVIGRHYVPRQVVRDQGVSADRIQSMVLHRGWPLAATQTLVTALCTAERRP